MRRIVSLAIILFCASSWAVAAPFDQLANDLDEFEKQVAPRTAKNKVQRASYQEQQPLEPVPVPTPDRGMQSNRVMPHSQGMPLDEGWGDSMGGYGGDCCGGDGCDSCCNQCGGFWGRVEYLGWWVRGSQVPALVTTSPDGTPANVAGVLPTASVLFGDQRINGQARSGGRFTVGFWCRDCSNIGIEDTAFFLGSPSDGYSNSSNGSPILARPFFNQPENRQDAVLLAFPQTVVGSINITSTSQVSGNELNLRRSLYVDCCRRVDVLAGYRFFHLNESLDINTNTTSVGTSAPTGTTFNVLDSFSARNNFNGGQIGLNSVYTSGCWSLDLLAKVALGGVSQSVTIDGSTLVTVPGQSPVHSRGGILAQNSNIGAFSRNRFAVLPEFGANLHYQITPLWTVNVGYTFMLLTNVLRPGDQIDTNLDPAQFPPGQPGTFPKFAFHDSDIWLQGINVGLECNF